MTQKPANRNDTPTRFAVESYESRSRNFLLLIGASTLILMALWKLDPNIQNDILWILGGLGIGLLVLETAPVKRKGELAVEVGPLGIQRTTQVNPDRITHHPLLPRSCIRDCIVIEHVQAFGVTNHLVFRVESSTSPSSKLVVPVFPGATLTFEQCQQMSNLIRHALLEQ